MISIERDETSLWQFQNVVEEADFQNERTTFDLKKVYIIIRCRVKCLELKFQFCAA